MQNDLVKLALLLQLDEAEEDQLASASPQQLGPPESAAAEAAEDEEPEEVRQDLAAACFCFGCKCAVCEWLCILIIAELHPQTALRRRLMSTGTARFS